MASLTAGPNLGGGSVSSLLKSASTIANEVAAFQDESQSLDYANSAYTDDALSTYQTYLQGRIDGLNSSGSITNASKALTLTKTLESAVKSNTSATIQRENIQVMSGNGTLQDKYNVIVGQYTRAINNGDFTLAQSLESQAYSVSQSIQVQAQTAADSAATLGKAATTAGVANEQGIIDSLGQGIKLLDNAVKNTGQGSMNASVAKFLSPENSKTLAALGVSIKASPNYFDLVAGLTGAQINAYKLKAAAYAGTDPNASQTAMNAAINLNNGTTKISTLGGSLTIQQIMDASANPSMFAFDAGSGTYKITKQSGFNGYDQNGEPLPTYTGNLKQTVFLSPTQTNMLTKYGLSFTENTTGKNAGTTGNGVEIQASGNTPAWMANLIGGQNGITNAYVDKNGMLSFEGESSQGGGKSYYTLAQDDNGLRGLFEHNVDGSTTNIGGDYGFNAGAVQLLVNTAQQTQKTIAVQTAANNAATAAASAAALKVAPLAPAPQLAAGVRAPNSPLPQTVNPQVPTFNPQQASPGGTKALQPAGQVQSNVQGAPLQRQALPGIKF